MKQRPAKVDDELKRRIKALVNHEVQDPRDPRAYVSLRTILCHNWSIQPCTDQAIENTVDGLSPNDVAALVGKWDKYWKGMLDSVRGSSGRKAGRLSPPDIPDDLKGIIDEVAWRELENADCDVYRPNDNYADYAFVDDSCWPYDENDSRRLLTLLLMKRSTVRVRVDACQLPRPIWYCLWRLVLTLTERAAQRLDFSRGEWLHRSDCLKKP